jgi:two-component system chemotaxis response regulator CheB
LEGTTALAPYATIVIGASTGGIEILQEIVTGIPADIPAAIFIVQHIGRHPSHLPEVLERFSVLPVRHARHLERIQPQRVIVAPSDHHLTLQHSRMCLSRGPRENWARPAIDPLFRSAAEVFDGTTIGVILSGSLNDGSAGLLAIRFAGGKTVIQDPKTARAADMPASALRYAGADYCVPPGEIGPLLAKLSQFAVSSSGDQGRQTAGGPRHDQGI